MNDEASDHVVPDHTIAPGCCIELGVQMKSVDCRNRVCQYSMLSPLTISRQRALYATRHGLSTRKAPRPKPVLNADGIYLAVMLVSVHASLFV